MRRLVGLMLGCVCSGLAWASDCVSYWQADDRALFRFVQTREKASFADYEGLSIGNIEVVVLPVFNTANPDEDLWLYRLANRVHIPTRRATVRRQLTLRSGAAVSTREVEENERLLRQKTYFADAMILPAQRCGDQLDLLVVVRDVWTLTPIASASRQGGEDTASAGLSYDNAFGSGQSVTVAWSRDVERDSVTTAWSATDLFRQHVSASLAYVDSSDGELRLVDLQRPFYQLDSRWSAGVRWYQERYQEDVELLDVLLNRYSHETRFQEVMLGWSSGLHEGRVVRWRVGLREREQWFVATDPPSTVPADERLLYPWLSAESLSDRFWRATNISFSHRQEDIPLGWRWQVGAGVADRHWQSSEDAWLYQLGISHTRRGGNHHLARVSLDTQGRWRTETDELVDSVAALEARYYYFISRKDRWFASLRLEAARGIRQDQELTSGGSDILRGYPLNTQRGDRRWVFTVERRHFTDWHPFNLIRVGGAVYVDAGRSWDARDRYVQSSQTLINTGVGLRFSSSKSRVDRVLHVDYAIPLVARDLVDDHQLVIVGKLEF